MADVHNMDALIRAAAMFGALIGVPAPAAHRVSFLVSKLVEERQVLESTRLGLITKNEAALLVLAHFHSSLFDCGTAPTESAWENDELLELVKHGLFG